MTWLAPHSISSYVACSSFCSYPEGMSPEPRKPKVLISSSQTAMRIPRMKLTELIAFVARQESARIAEVDIAVVGTDEMASLNRRYLHQASPTDVLSFDLSEADGEGICAQLVICGDVAVAQAHRRNLSPQRELMLYVVHGLLHLMHYEDRSVRGAARMHDREAEILDVFCSKRKKK